MSKKYLQEMFLMGDDALNIELENVSAADFRAAIALALKEQDRDTRHLAAERVNMLALDDNTIKTAHSVIMNAVAI